jgi:DNA/RNA-binding domain of Phe-tRNA-synthetase-like protein
MSGSVLSCETFWPFAIDAMIFIVAEECLKLGLRAGAVLFRDVHVSSAAASLRTEIASAVQAIHARFPNPQAVSSLTEVAAFRDILGKVGVNPRKEQPSVERLIAFALKRGDLPAINSLVDAYNLVSVRSLCSLGAHDLDRIALPVSLRLLTGRETFTPLGRDNPMSIVPGEFGYVDAVDRVLCRLDLLQAEFSKVTTSTVNALLIIEGTSAHSPELLRQTFDEAIALVTRFCGGSAELVALPGPC